ncbi:MAG: glycosyltransferase family 2 protein [Candidatus Omnitrophica bacterium]|nr:glycosyltransferase family 2 protein [Candidatus Omnitrophota bacterium]
MNPYAKQISVVIVAYNSEEFIEDCLDSLARQDFKDFEVIIIDNNSKDKTKEIIKIKYPDVHIIENHSNEGPCKARNQGIAVARGEFILCLDHDTRFHQNFLGTLYSSIKNRDCIAGVGPKILMADTKIIYSFGIHRTFLRRFYDIGSGKKDLGVENIEKYVFGVSAAAVLYRKKALEDIWFKGEYFDKDFFYFLEDVDISWRMRKKGWEFLYLPQAQCLHIGGRSRKKDGISQYLCMRNRYLLIIKNESLFGLLRFLAVFPVYDLWRILFMLLANTRYCLKALNDIRQLYPAMVGKRYSRNFSNA